MTTTTLDDCLATFRDVLPDIDADLVETLYTEAQAQAQAHPHHQQHHQTKVLGGAAPWCEAAINEILENGGSYPKSQARQARKRKRDESEIEDGDYEEYRDEEVESLGIGTFETNAVYSGRAVPYLRVDFPDIPQRHIENSLKTHKYLYSTHLALAQQQRTMNSGKNAPYVSLKRPARPLKKLIMSIVSPLSEQLMKELQAARRHRNHLINQEVQATLRAKLEADNEERARLANQMIECGCCFSDIPINRSVSCNGDETHPFCYECIQRLVETRIGNLHCDINCMDMSGCQAGFLRSELARSIDRRIMDRLELLQTKESIRLAGLEDLVECLFCEYQAICEEPVEVDREFRCQNPECGKISCRLCLKETHTPMTCEENANHTKLDAKHSVEEAMTDAMVRKCIKCKVPFCKESGCNKMSCPRCFTLQCYICSQEIKDYSHFDRTTYTPNQRPAERLSNKCPLYEDTAQRHKEEVEAAEKKAIQRIREENPDLKDDELKVERPITVPSTEGRHGHAGNYARPINYHVVNIMALPYLNLAREDFRRLRRRTTLTNTPEAIRQYLVPQFNNQWPIPQAQGLNQPPVLYPLPQFNNQWPVPQVQGLNQPPVLYPLPQFNNQRPIPQSQDLNQQPILYPLPQFNNQWPVPQAHELNQQHVPQDQELNQRHAVWDPGFNNMGAYMHNQLGLGNIFPENDQMQPVMDLFGEEWNAYAPRRHRRRPRLHIDGNGQPVPLFNADWNDQPVPLFNADWNGQPVHR